MDEVFQALSAFAALIAMLVGIPAWVASLYYLVLISRSTIHGKASWRRSDSILAFFRWQPFSPLLDASELTPKGLVYRRRCFLSALFFTGPILAAFFFRALAR